MADESADVSSKEELSVSDDLRVESQLNTS